MCGRLAIAMGTCSPCGSNLSLVFFTPYAAVIGLASHSTISSESQIPTSTINTTGFKSNWLCFGSFIYSDRDRYSFGRVNCSLYLTVAFGTVR